MGRDHKPEYPKVYLYRRIVQAKLYIDDHYGEPINLDNISDEAWFSKYHFIRLYKKAYGKTPHQYLMKVRIDKAKEMLKTGMPVNDACYAVGFESTTSFTALFKRSAGLTPSQYRSRQLFLNSEKDIAPMKFIPGCFSGKSEKSNFREVIE